MKRMTIRDIRLRWPEAERTLNEGDEIVVTRDGRPVARIVAYEEPAAPDREQFDARSHLAWLAKFWKGKADSTMPSSEELLAIDRAD